MADRVRCLKCSKIIDCSPYDTPILLQHIKTDHPEILLPEDDTMEYRDTENASTNNNYSGRRGSGSRVQLPHQSANIEEESIRSPGRKALYTRKYLIHSPQRARSPQHRRLYKTSIEKWRPAKGTIHCPKCGANKRPIIRTRSEKLSHSNFGAACILTCWPLCFLPCLFPATSKDYLHCAECNNFLGMYDKDNNCIRPNREFVEGSENRLDRSATRRLSDSGDGNEHTERGRQRERKSV